MKYRILSLLLSCLTGSVWGIEALQVGEISSQNIAQRFWHSVLGNPYLIESIVDFAGHDDVFSLGRLNQVNKAFAKEASIRNFILKFAQHQYSIVQQIYCDLSNLCHDKQGLSTRSSYLQTTWPTLSSHVSLKNLFKNCLSLLQSVDPEFVGIFNFFNHNLDQPRHYTFSGALYLNWELTNPIFVPHFSKITAQNIMCYKKHFSILKKFLESLKDNKLILDSINKGLRIQTAMYIENFPTKIKNKIDKWEDRLLLKLEESFSEEIQQLINKLRYLRENSEISFKIYEDEFKIRTEKKVVYSWGIQELKDFIEYIDRKSVEKKVPSVFKDYNDYIFKFYFLKTYINNKKYDDKMQESQEPPRKKRALNKE